MSIFNYDPLPPVAKDECAEHIRLLKLLPGPDDQRLHIELVHSPLLDHKSYDAISYCWGGQTPTVPIQCGTSELLITANLASCLLELRKTLCKEKPLRVWADAICINQNDNLEKGSQVAIMKEIYQQATATHIWFGGYMTPKDLNSAFKTIFDIRLLALSADVNDDPTISEYFREKVSMAPTKLSLTQSSRWPMVKKLLSHPWFGRIWIIQEIVMSRNASLVFEGYRYPWDKFSGSIIHAVTLKSNRLPPMPSTFNIQQIDLLKRKAPVATYAASSQSFLGLLLAFKQSSATDARDKVFALLGISPDHDPGIKADYHIRSSEVYIAVAKTCLEHHDLRILGTASSKSEVDGVLLPSWVPNWSDGSTNSPSPLVRISMFFHEYLGFRASKKAELDYRVDGHKLHIKGIILHQIRTLGKVMDSSAFHGDSQMREAQVANRALLSLILEDWEQVCQIKQGGNYINGQTRSEAYYRTLNWNDFSILYEPDAFARDLKLFTRAYGPRNLTNSLRRKGFSGTSKVIAAPFQLGRVTGGVKRMIHSDDWEYHSKLKETTFCRRIMVSEEGYFGLVPGRTEEGDYVCIFAGAKAPHVIRKKGEEWELVGDCYVHGIMDGELWDEEKCVEITIV